MNNIKISILGSGAFGKAIKTYLNKRGYDTRVWTRGMNIEEYASDMDYIIFAVPAQAFRGVFTKAAPFIGDAVVINLAKGIEQESLLRLSQVAEEIYPECKYVALSGPSHAEEIMEEMPTDVCVSSRDLDCMLKVQDLLHSDILRVYTNKDLVGVELGGAVKNVIALASGISEGMGYGDNTRAALMTRGLAEMRRLGIAMGAKADSFLGLSGVGDLIVTCGSMHSRNRRCGIMLGKGVSLSDAQDEIGQVVEGITSCYAVYALSQKYSVDMPITAFLYSFLNGKISLKAGAMELMSRDRKEE